MRFVATIDNQVEFALYLLAVRHPHDFQEVKDFSCAMLANDETKANQAKAITHGALRANPAVRRAAELLEQHAPTGAEFDGTDAVLVSWERHVAIEARGLVEALS